MYTVCTAKTNKNTIMFRILQKKCLHTLLHGGLKYDYFYLSWMKTLLTPPPEEKETGSVYATAWGVKI